MVARIRRPRGGGISSAQPGRLRRPSRPRRTGLATQRSSGAPSRAAARPYGRAPRAHVASSSPTRHARPAPRPRTPRADGRRAPLVRSGHVRTRRGQRRPPPRARSSRRSGTTTSSSQEPGAPTVIGIDLHLVHEVTSPQAFEGLRRRGLTVRHPERTVATADHSTPTHDRSLPILDQQASFQLAKLAANCAEFGVPLYALGSDRQGIVHVIGPELGLTQPGMTIVCGDSHTATHGAFGALAFGIGTSEVEMVLATQTLLQRAAAHLRGPRGRPPGAGRHLQGHHPQPHQPHRRGRRHGPRLRVHRRGHPRADDGAAHDHLQHVHRGWRTGRAHRPGRHDLRVRRRSAARPAGRRLRRRRGALAHASPPTPAPSTRSRSPSTPPPWSR